MKSPCTQIILSLVHVSSNVTFLELDHTQKTRVLKIDHGESSRNAKKIKASKADDSAVSRVTRD